MKNYTYSGPVSVLTYKGEDGKRVSTTLTKRTEPYSLPEGAKCVASLVSKKLLREVAQQEAATQHEGSGAARAGSQGSEPASGHAGDAPVSAAPSGDLATTPEPKSKKSKGGKPDDASASDALNQESSNA